MQLELAQKPEPTTQLGVIEVVDNFGTRVGTTTLQIVDDFGSLIAPCRPGPTQPDRAT